MEHFIVPAFPHELPELGDCKMIAEITLSEAFMGRLVRLHQQLIQTQNELKINVQHLTLICNEPVLMVALGINSQLAAYVEHEDNFVEYDSLTDTMIREYAESTPIPINAGHVVLDLWYDGKVLYFDKSVSYVLHQGQKEIVRSAWAGVRTYGVALDRLVPALTYAKGA